MGREESSPPERSEEVPANQPPRNPVVHNSVLLLPPLANGRSHASASGTQPENGQLQRTGSPGPQYEANYDQDDRSNRQGSHMQWYFGRQQANHLQEHDASTWQARRAQAHVGNAVASYAQIHAASINDVNAPLLNIRQLHQLHQLLRPRNRPQHEHSQHLADMLMLHGRASGHPVSVPVLNWLAEQVSANSTERCKCRPSLNKHRCC